MFDEGGSLFLHEGLRAYIKLERVRFGIHFGKCFDEPRKSIVGRCDLKPVDHRAHRSDELFDRWRANHAPFSVQPHERLDVQRKQPKRHATTLRNRCHKSQSSRPISTAAPALRKSVRLPMAAPSPGIWNSSARPSAF